MSKQVLIDTYSKYGASTKRGNNLEAGQLGLGSKSGFAYTDQFTVRSVHNGHCCELIMSRNDRGAAEMTIAFDYATDDPSGVTVTIPIKNFDVDSVIDEVETFATYAKPNTVEVNGKLNEIPESWNKIADGLYSTNEISQHIIVMGNVAYPAKLFEQTWLGYRAERIIAFVGMGEVDFVPSRESLKYTRHTQATIAGIEQYLRDSVAEQAQNMVDNAQTVREKVEAYKLSLKWERFFPNGIVQIDIQDDINEIVRNEKFFSAKLPFNISDRHDRIYNDFHTTMSFGKVVQLISDKKTAILNFPSERVSRDQARKLLAIKPELANERVMLFGEKNEGLKDIFTDWNFLSWEDFKSVRTPRPKSNRTKTKTQQGNLYRGQLVHKRNLQGNDRMMKVTGPSYFCSQTELDHIPWIFFPREDFKLFLVIPSRQEAFMKKNPEAKSLKEYSRNKRQQVLNHIKSSPRVSVAIKYAHNPSYINRMIDFDRLTNRDFLDKVRMARTGHKWKNLSGRMYYPDQFDSYLSANYPLVRMYSRPSPLEIEHITDYINMIGEKNDA